MAVEQANVVTMADYLDNNGLGKTEKSSSGKAMQVVDDVTAHYAGRSSKDENAEDVGASIQTTLDKFKETAAESKIVSFEDQDDDNPLKAFLQTQEVEITEDFVKEGKKLLNKLRTDLESVNPKQVRAKAAVFNTEAGKEALSKMFTLIGMNADDNDDLATLQKSARTFINEVIEAKTANMSSSYSSADPSLKYAVDKILSSGDPGVQFKAVASIVGRADDKILKIADDKSKLYRQIAKAYGGGDLGKEIAGFVHSKITTLTSTMPSKELDEALQDEDLQGSYNKIRSAIGSAYKEKITDKIEKQTDDKVRDAAKTKLDLIMDVYEAKSIDESVVATKALVSHYAEQAGDLAKLTSTAQAFSAISKKLQTAARSTKPSPVVLDKQSIDALDDKTKKELIEHLQEQFEVTVDKKSDLTYADEITNAEVAKYLEKRKSKSSINFKLGKVTINVAGKENIDKILDALNDSEEIDIVKDGKTTLLSKAAINKIKEQIAEDLNKSKTGPNGADLFKELKNGTKTIDEVIAEGKIPELTLSASKDSEVKTSNLADRIAKELAEAGKKAKKDLSKEESLIRKVERSVFMPAAKAIPSISLTVGSSLLNIMYNEDGLSEEMLEALGTAAEVVLDTEKTKYIADANPALERTLDMQMKEQVDQVAAPEVNGKNDVKGLLNSLGFKGSLAQALKKFNRTVNDMAPSGSSLSIYKEEDLELMNGQFAGLTEGKKAMKEAKQYAFILAKLEALLSNSSTKSDAEREFAAVKKSLPAKQSLRNYSNTLSRVETNITSKLEKAEEARKKLADLDGHSNIWDAADDTDADEGLKKVSSNLFSSVVKNILRATGLKRNTFAQPVKDVKESNGDDGEEEGTASYARAVFNFIDASMQSSESAAA